MELEAAYREFNEATDEVFGKSEDGDEVASSAAPCRHDHEAGMSTSAADSNEE